MKNTSQELATPHDEERTSGSEELAVATSMETAARAEEVAELRLAADPDAVPFVDARPTDYSLRGHRRLDWVLLALTMPIVVPLGVAIWVLNAIAFRSPRRALFVQRRIGRGGRVFKILKFRTMKRVPNNMRHWKEGNDALRVTRLGRFLRNTHFDELPQIWNVARGDMSFIGPRPEVVEVVRWAQEQVPGFERQYAVAPGITGLAQITQGYVGCDAEGYATKLGLNLRYMREASLSLDMSIVFRTVWWMLRRKGWKFTPPPGSVAENGTVRECVTDFLDLLDERDVSFAVLRGGEVREEGGSAADVDLLVDPGDIGRFEHLLRESCRASGGRVFETHRGSYTRQYFIHVRTPAGKHEFIAIDLHAAETCFGVPFLTAEELLAARQTGSDRLEDVPSAVVNFLTPYLSGRMVHRLYAERLRHVAKRDYGAVARLLASIFGPALSLRLLESLEHEDEARLQRLARSSRRALWRRAFCRHPLRSALGAWACVYAARIRPWMRPRGRVVAFLGTDGSGKTTLLEAVMKRLERVYRSDRSGVFHMRPGLLPQINTLVHLGRTTYTIADMSRPHRAAPSGPIGSSLRVAYYWTDYLLGTLVRILPRRRRHSLIAFDRYFYDYLVDPLRSRIQRGTLLVRVLARWVPRPDDVFVCSASAATVLERKQELPLDEVERQIAGYEELARQQGFQVIDTSRDPEECVDLVLDAMFPIT